MVIENKNFRLEVKFLLANFREDFVGICNLIFYSLIFQKIAEAIHIITMDFQILSLNYI